MLRIKQVHRDSTDTGGLFKDYDFTEEQANDVLNFMWDKKAKLRELSLRMALKIADLVKVSESNWKMLAENTVMRQR
jgi:hypothetical protein